MKASNNRRWNQRATRVATSGLKIHDGVSEAQGSATVYARRPDTWRPAICGTLPLAEPDRDSFISANRRAESAPRGLRSAEVFGTIRACGVPSISLKCATRIARTSLFCVRFFFAWAQRKTSAQRRRMAYAPELRRRERFAFRCRPHERVLIDRAASESRQPLSEWIRDTLVEAARRVLAADPSQECPR